MICHSNTALYCSRVVQGIELGATVPLNSSRLKSYHSFSSKFSDDVVDKYAASRFLSAVQLLSYQNNLNYALQQCGLEKVSSQALNKVQCMEYKLRAQIGQIYFYMDLGVV